MPIKKPKRINRMSISILLTVGILLSASLGVVAQDVNVAFRKSASQSSTGFAFAGAEVAVDGKTDGKFVNGSSNSVTHTAGGNPAWWEVDLGRIYDIDRIVLWNRTDCCRERLDGFKIIVGETRITTNDTRIFASDMFFGGRDARTFSSRLILRGRYVRVEIPRGIDLSLAEVQVFEKNPPPTPLPTPTPTAGTTDPDQEEWERADQVGRRTVADYLTYLRRFPNGRFETQAKNEIRRLGGTVPVTPTPSPTPVSTPTPPTNSSDPDTEEWERADKVGRRSVADYQTYLRRFPNGKFEAQAKAEIRRQGGTVPVTPTPAPTPSSGTGTSDPDQEEWERADRPGRRSVADYQVYLQRFPNGKFATQAAAEIRRQGGTVPVNPGTKNPAFDADQIAWDRADQNGRGTLRDYLGYLDSFPTGKFQKLAEFQIKRLGGTVPTPPATGPTPTADADQQEWDRADAPGRRTISDYQTYLNRFPNGKFAQQAKNEIQRQGGTVIVPPPPPVVTASGRTWPEIIAAAQTGNIGELGNKRKFFVKGSNGSVRSNITNAIRKEIQQMSATGREIDAEFFLIMEFTDRVTGQATEFDSANPNLEGRLIVYTVITWVNGAPFDIRIHHSDVKGRNFGVFSDTPDRNTAKDFAKSLKNVLF